MGGKNFRPHLVRVDSNLEMRGEERRGEEEGERRQRIGERGRRKERRGGGGGRKENNEERQEEGRDQSNASYSSSASCLWTYLLSDGSCSSPVVSSEQNHPQSHPVQSMHRHRSLRLDGVCNHQSSQQDTWKERSHCIVTVTMANYYSSALVSPTVSAYS